MKVQTLEEEIILLLQEAKLETISIREILHVLKDKGRFLILLLLSLPFCQPIQIPGLSTPFGLIIAFLGLRIAFGKKVWLPQKLLDKTVPGSTLQKILDKILYLVRKIKPWIYPRLTWFCNWPVLGKKGNGLIICFLGIFLALPLPIPLSNLMAAMSIFLIALGDLEDDGLLVLLGYLICALVIVFFIFLVLTAEYYLG